jgi:hypothetical protein
MDRNGEDCRETVGLSVNKDNMLGSSGDIFVRTDDSLRKTTRGFENFVLETHKVNAGIRMLMPCPPVYVCTFVGLVLVDLWNAKQKRPLNV